MATSHGIKPFYDVNVTQEEVYDVCRRHRILPQHYQCYWRLVALAEVNSTEFRWRLFHCRSYERATDEILALASRGIDDQPLPKWSDVA